MSVTPEEPVDPRVVGQRIKNERQERGLTLAQLAQAAGSSAPHLSQVENGRREPTLRLLGGLATALGVPVEQLLRPEPPTRSGLQSSFMARPAQTRVSVPHRSPDGIICCL